MRSVRAESCASRGAEKSRKTFTEAGRSPGKWRGHHEGEARCRATVPVRSDTPEPPEPREVRRPHDDGHGSAPRVEGDVLALQRELVDEHGQPKSVDGSLPD
jgi:hypothetical protein